MAPSRTGSLVLSAALPRAASGGRRARPRLQAWAPHAPKLGDHPPAAKSFCRKARRRLSWALPAVRRRLPVNFAR